MKFQITLILFLVASQAFSQDQYQVLKDRDGTKMLKGLISRDVLESDTSFSWFASGKKFFKPDATAVSGFKKMGDSLQLIVFMGTWCEDSHFVIPKMFVLTDEAGFSKDRVSLLAVDRDKKTLSHLSEAMNVTLVPTIIVMKKGKEIGRVVEYGKSGSFDKELGEIINQAL